MKIDKNKFKCRYCNKSYSSALGAVNCSCKKNIKWGNPGRGRKSEVKKVSYPKTIYSEEDLITSKFLIRTSKHTKGA